MELEGVAVVAFMSREPVVTLLLAGAEGVATLLVSEWQCDLRHTRPEGVRA